MAVRLPRQQSATQGQPVRAATRSGARSTGTLPATVGSTTVRWVLAVVFGFPVLWFILSSLKPAGDLFSYPLTLFPESWNFSGYEAAWQNHDFARYFVNTSIVAVTTTVLTVIASACTGYALAKYTNRWLKVFFICILATTMLPTEVILTPTFLVIRDLGLY